MMRFALALFLLSASAAAAPTSSSCPTQGFPSGKNTMVTAKGFDASGKTRRYHVYVPSSYNNSVPVTLHLALHGLNAPCLNIFNAFKATADARGYILVAPCGSIGDAAISMGIGWNSGRCCGFKPSSTTDDFAFMRLIVENVKSKLCIDDDKVFASGFSNGAMMAEVLACKAADVFKAVASVSGVVELNPGNAGGLAACDTAVKNSTKRASVLNVHGTLDPMVPWQSDPIIGFPPIPKDFSTWAARSGCPSTPKDNWTKGKYSSQIYTGCTGGASIELVKNTGGTHEWPQDSNFDTTKYVNAFFDKAAGITPEQEPHTHERVEAISRWPKRD